MPSIACQREHSNIWKKFRYVSMWITVLLSYGAGMVYNGLSVVWKEICREQENAWFTVHTTKNTFQSLVFHFYQWQLMCRWFQCLIQRDIFPLYAVQSILPFSEFPRLFKVKASLLFLLWNWPSQLLASMLHSCKFLQFVLIMGIYLSNRMYIMAEE